VVRDGAPQGPARAVVVEAQSDVDRDHLTTLVALRAEGAAALGADAGHGGAALPPAQQLHIHCRRRSCCCSRHLLLLLLLLLWRLV
jgi:hypothetical protein